MSISVIDQKQHLLDQLGSVYDKARLAAEATGDRQLLEIATEVGLVHLKFASPELHAEVLETWRRTKGAENERF